MARTSRSLVAASVVVSGLLATGIVALLSRPPPRPETDASPPGVASRAAARRPGEATSRKRPGPEIPPPTPTSEDLWALAPTDAGGRAQEEEAFLLGGGIRTTGADPSAGRLAVAREGWAEEMEASLERSLRYEVLVGGAEVDRIDCAAGRCLVELRFESMRTALERVEPLREWLGERVDCAAYSDGPAEADTPSGGPSQQIWITCGEPAEASTRG